MAIANNQQPASGELPTISGYMKNPSNRKLMVGLGGGILLMIFLVVIAVFTRGNNGPTPTPIPTHVPTATPVITSGTTTPDQDCFKNCSDEEFIQRLGTKLEALKYVKQAAVFHNTAQNSCYGLYYEATTTSWYAGSYVPQDCGVSTTYVQQAKEYRLDDKVYIYNLDNKSWDTGTGSRITRLKIFDTYDLLKNQQEISSEVENTAVGSFRVFNGSSRSVNDFNQVVNISLEVTVNSNFEITSYKEFAEEKLVEAGSYFSYNVPVEIDEPETN